MTRWQKISTWLLANWRPCAMLVLVALGYAVKKSATLTSDESELLEGIWFALGLGAVFTPNFKRPDIE